SRGRKVTKAFFNGVKRVASLFDLGHSTGSFDPAGFFQGAKSLLGPLQVPESHGPRVQDGSRRRCRFPANISVDVTVKEELFAASIRTNGGKEGMAKALELPREAFQVPVEAGHVFDNPERFGCPIQVGVDDSKRGTTILH